MVDAPSRWLNQGTALPTGPNGRGRVRAGWFAEGFSPHEYHCHRIRAVLRSTKTPFQECVLCDTYSYGRCLVLDGEMQSAQRDEFIYHEALVQPPMIVHPGARRVFIMGGGEGATAREALKRRSVEQVVMADIDAEVLGFCRKFMPTWHQGSMDHPKVRLLVEDAREFILRSSGTFDVILSDLPSAIRGGPAYKLYTVEFYRQLRRRLAPNGIFCLQGGSGQMLQIAFHAALYNTLRQVFRVVRPYYAYIPVFDVPWAFIFCTDDASLDPLRFSARRIDGLIRNCGIRPMRFMDGTAFEGLFRVPRYFRESIAAERRVITEKRPVYFFN